MDKLLKVLTDPVSNRILQKIRTRGKMTISEIISENPQLPRATVYRKIDKMLEVGAIYVAETHKVRGQTENVYSIKEMYIASRGSNEEDLSVITIGLMRILDLYDQYFRSGEANAERDRIFMLNYAIALSDNDFSDMMNEIFRIVDKYQNKPETENAKLRNLYLMSAPGGEYNEKLREK